ncbi:peptidoglycan editing factor PgeF [Celerinatantimonas diazotrophica]|uniref:Purine nucleoside phosphorylase n=1 Tax=Celerinatantimonas diazotrophica TaxID=412034 RepID=A0A4R1J8Z0_9GAMM|nr:peptidoglycan editing factor PgeF [Celerinatantimonas diazotrophica]TCK47052.1 hypothetical protein EV690_3206 [Celerinatantimonas diazotrophica]CAG9295820.1 Polyphenol oxidase [Celerinatantimonas diazotrophica]
MAVYNIESVFPDTVKAVYTDRLSGYSQEPYESYNLGSHVGDVKEHVARNRRDFASYLPSMPCWLNQVHSIKLADAGLCKEGVEADGSYTRGRNIPCVVMVADCLPILLADKQGRAVSAVHGGWRGLAGGIIEHAVAKLGCPANELVAWLGPAIGADAFQVGPEVFTAFTKLMGDTAQNAFQADGDRYLADLKLLAQLQLNQLGVEHVTIHPACTYHDSTHFFSYRRDGQTGRMAAAIWLE